MADSLPKNEQDWQDAISNAPPDQAQELQKQYQHWTALGGEEPLKLPDDFKAPPGGPKQTGSMTEAYQYLKSILPSVKADYGNNDKTSYEAQQQKLQTFLQSGAASPEESKKAQLLLGDLNDHFRKQAGQWYAEDLRNAKSPEEAAQIQAKMDSLKQNSLENVQQGMVADIVAGGSGFGEAQGWDGKMGSSGNGMAQPYLDQMVNEWNGQSLGDLYDQVGEKIVDNTNLRGQEQLGYYDQGANRALGGLGDANKAASDRSAQALADLRKSGNLTKDQIDQELNGLKGALKDTNAKADESVAGVKDAYGKFGTERDQAAKDYLDSMSPLQKQLQAQGYTAAKTSADDINRLLDSYGQLKDNAQHGTDQLQDVYGRYQDLADQKGMSAQERAIVEATNRNQARSMKSQQDAAIASLRTRGMLSGGNVMAANAATSANLGDDRIQTAMQALASAQARQQAALTGMGTTANQIASQKNVAGANQMTGAQEFRTGNDAMEQFNTSQQGITQRFQDSFAQEEQKRLADIAQKKVDTNLTKTSGDFTASGQLNSAQQEALNNSFGRTATTTNTSLTADQNKYAIDSGQTQQEIQDANNSAGRAAAQTGAELTSTNNRTGLIGSTGSADDEALKYLLGLKAEKEALRQNGGKVPGTSL